MCEIRSEIDLARFAGVWHEYMRTRGIVFQPDDTTNVTSVYTYDGERMHMRMSQRVRRNVVEWTARVIEYRNAFKTVWRIEGDIGAPFKLMTYRILMLDHDSYQWAVVACGDDNEYLWILTRERAMLQDSVYAHIIECLQDDFEYDTDRLVYTKHVAAETPRQLAAKCEPAKTVPVVVQRTDGFVVKYAP